MDNDSGYVDTGSALRALGEDFKRKKPKGRLDLSTWVGFIGGFALILSAIAYGGSVLKFFDLPSVLIVFGGTFAATLISFSFSELGDTRRSLVHALFDQKHDPIDSAQLMITLCEIARKKGILVLDRITDEFKREPILYKSVAMVVDGSPFDQVKFLLQQEITSLNNSFYKSVEVMRRAAEFAPAMGLIGTLVGLVHMLGNLNDPGTIGPSMAVALLTTFYGAVASNLILLPLASKLEKRAREEALNHHIYYLGSEALAKQTSPRDLEAILNSIMPVEKQFKTVGS